MAEPGPRDAAGERTWPVPWQEVWGEADGFGSRLGHWAASGALALATRLPERALAGLLEVLAALAMRIDRRRVRAAHEFLQQALGPLPADELARRTQRAFVQLLRVTVDTERVLAGRPAQLAACVELVFSPAARAALAARRGCLLVSAHIGNWELCLPAMAAAGFHPVYGVAKPPKNRFLSAALQASRERHGVRILSRKGAMGAAPAVLKAGGTIGLVIDQRTSGRALLAPFFGRLARCERAPGVLLKRQRVPIVIVSCSMTSGPRPFRYEFGNVLEPEEWARREVGEIATRINQELEAMIRAHPEQYVWIHDRYRDTPRTLDPGAAARILRTPSPESGP